MELQKSKYYYMFAKNGKDNLLLENWRPISLLNVDYKLTAKAVANTV